MPSLLALIGWLVGWLVCLFVSFFLSFLLSFFLCLFVCLFVVFVCCVCLQFVYGVFSMICPIGAVKLERSD